MIEHRTYFWARRQTILLLLSGIQAASRRTPHNHALSRLELLMSEWLVPGPDPSFAGECSSVRAGLSRALDVVALAEIQDNMDMLRHAMIEVLLQDISNHEDANGFGH